MEGIKLVMSDLAVSFLWVVSVALVKVVVSSDGLGLKGNVGLVRGVLSVANMFVFAWLGRLTGGASFNPVTALLQTFSGTPHRSVYTLAARIPAQALGSLGGVVFVKHVMPRGGPGPQLKVGVQGGMVAEGFLTFIVAFVALFVSTRGPKGYFLSTWITSLSKLTVSILGADYTGPAMNPATAFGWAYARGQHTTKEHLYVYWLAPVEATLLAVWIFRIFVVPPPKQHRRPKKESIKKD